MINKILVAVDRFEREQSIFNTAVSLAQTNNAKLMLLNIRSPIEANYPALITDIYYPMANNREYEMYQQQIEDYRQEELNFLQDLTKKAIAVGVDAEHRQLIGNPGQIICRIAATWSADLILVGSRGLKGLKEMFLGSVSNYVTHHAPCSVLIVRHPTDTKPRSPSSESEEDSELLTFDFTQRY